MADAVVGKQLHMVLHEARVSAILAPCPLAPTDMKNGTSVLFFLWAHYIIAKLHNIVA